MPEVNSSKYYVTAGWTDAPHLDEKTKREIEQNTPPHLRAARMRGEPSLGAGAVYPVNPDDFRIAPFPIPEHFYRGYGLDVGWNRTAAIWGAHDRDNDILYLYNEHYLGQREPSVHADAIKARGKWIPGFIDPASQGSSQVDGKKLIEEYRKRDLNLTFADNAVEAGILEVYQRLSSGRLKVFSTLTNFFDEYRFYIRDEKTGKIVKKNDHCLHPDTLVITDKGSVPIRDLVGTSGNVLSIDGKYQPYRNCRMTAKNQTVVRVEFEDGSHVVCTPDHKFMTSNGWMEAIDLEGVECYDAVSHRVKGLLPCKSTSYRLPSRSLKGADTISVANIFNGMVNACMSLFGAAPSVRTHPRGGMSIIGTGIVQTISRKISNLNTALTISANTSAGILVHWLQRLMSRPPSGMVLMLAGSGISNTTGRWPTSSIRPGNLCASNAPSHSRLGTSAPIAFAPTPARQGSAFCPASTTRHAPAPSAGRSSSSTNTSRGKHAGRHAGLRCIAVQTAGHSDVYCLTVPTTAAFAIEGGVIVHNCMDSMRYLIMSIPKMILRPLPTSAPTQQYKPIDARAGY